MSFQIAMMAGMAAMTVAQAAQQASAAGAAGARAKAGIAEARRQADIEANMRSWAPRSAPVPRWCRPPRPTSPRPRSAFAPGSWSWQRRVEMARLAQANAIDMVARGGVATGQDSAAAIDAGNLAAGEEDIDNASLMGESAKKQLSFRKSNFQLAAGPRSCAGSLATPPPRASSARSTCRAPTSTPVPARPRPAPCWRPAASCSRWA